MANVDESLYLTPDAIERIERAERRPQRPGVQRAVAEGRNTFHDDVVAVGGISLVVLFLIVILLGVFNTGSSEQAPTARIENSSQTTQPTISTAARRDAVSHQGPVQPPTSSTAIQSQSTADLLPAGWWYGFVTNDTLLFDFPRRNATVIRRIPAGTNILSRQTTGLGLDPTRMEDDPSGWEIVVSDSGEFWGYAPLRPGVPVGESQRWPLPPGWARMQLVGTTPPLLQLPNGVVVPGDVIMRRIGTSNDFFVMSADGLSWGLGRFEIDAPNQDFSQNAAALTPQ